jgi:hypothetical protein
MRSISEIRCGGAQLSVSDGFFSAHLYLDYILAYSTYYENSVPPKLRFLAHFFRIPYLCNQNASVFVLLFMHARLATLRLSKGVIVNDIADDGLALHCLTLRCSTQCCGSVVGSTGANRRVGRLRWTTACAG